MIRWAFVFSVSGSAGREDEALLAPGPPCFSQLLICLQQRFTRGAERVAAPSQTVTQSSLPNILPPPQPSLEKVTSFKFSHRHLNHGAVAGRPKPHATMTPKAAQTKETLQRNLL